MNHSPTHIDTQPKATKVNTPFFSPMAQKKLSVGSANDTYEAEADAMADKVMRMQDTLQQNISHKGALVQRKCAHCEEEEKLRRKPLAESISLLIQKSQTKNSGELQVPNHIENQINSSRGSGNSMDNSTKNFMESRFDTDFSEVRIHTGSQAVQMSRELNAQAFTVGNDVYFNEGKYNPNSDSGKHLLAHELTHTIQQMGGIERKVQKKDISEYVSDLGDSIREGEEWIEDTARTTVDAVTETASDIADTALDYINQANSWLLSSAGILLQNLVTTLGGHITISPSTGIVVTFPRVCPIPASMNNTSLSPIDQQLMVPIIGIPLGAGVLSGNIGISATIDPSVAMQVGPFCLEGARLVIDPLSGTYIASGSVSATLAASMQAEARAGLRGEISYTGVVVIGGAPIPIHISIIGVEGGIAGLGRLIGATSLVVGGAIGYAGGRFIVGGFEQLNLGLAGDLFLGAYGQMDVLGNNFCRLYWEPKQWHGQVGTFINLGLGLSFGSSPFATVTPSITTGNYPFDQFSLLIGRNGFTDNCPIKDIICRLMNVFRLFPSQNGGVWSETGPYGPGPELTHKNIPGTLSSGSAMPGMHYYSVYTRTPGAPRTASCRGACGVDCDTCEHHKYFTYTNPITGETWVYTDFEDCNSHRGCRNHDAGFDWAQVAKGETGSGIITMIMPWHMAANIECACNYVALNCPAWAVGQPPYDSKIYFASSVTKVKTPPPILPTPPVLPLGTKSPEGTKKDPIHMIWYKPLSAYPQSLTLNDRIDGTIELKFGKTKQIFIPDPDVLTRPGNSRLRRRDEGSASFTVGILHKPDIGSVMQKNRSYRGILQGEPQDSFRRLMEILGHNMTNHGEDADHVVDLQFTGIDDFINLWPLNSHINQSSREFAKQIVEVDIDGNPNNRLELNDHRLLTKWFVIKSTKLF